MNYVAQQYYDGVLINGNAELDPNIFEQRARLENVDTKQLGLLMAMFNHTPFVVPIVEEFRRRN
jgi:hypothetical protein